MTPKERRKLAKLKYINKQSSRGKLMSDCDKLLSKIIRLERGELCEVHNKKCFNVGVSHILPKSRYPRLRYYRLNLFCCGWFCSHHYTHFNSHDPRAIQYEEAVIKKLGKNYRENLLIAEKMQPRLKMFYLQTLKMAFRQELKELED